MNITATGTKVVLDNRTLAFQKNNLIDTMTITVDTDQSLIKVRERNCCVIPPSARCLSGMGWR